MLKEAFFSKIKLQINENHAFVSLQYSKFEFKPL